MSADLLVELWDNLKPFISSKDRMDAADVLVKFFDENAMLDGAEFQTGFDKFLTAAIEEYVEHPDNEDEYDDEW